MDFLFDARTECYSVLTTMTIREYLTMAGPAHAAKGGLTGQRDTLNTTTAKRIRERMVGDIRRGAILPPVVIGVVVPAQQFDSLELSKAESIDGFLPENKRSEIAIIDGMQRTSAMIDAASTEPKVLDNSVRVEFWLTKSLKTMIYRMLVLNTGQVPWTLSRQLSVVFAPLLTEVIEKVPEIARVFTPDQPGRRVAAAEISADALIELYITFSLRKTNVDMKEALSDEFSRLDFVENLSQREFQDQFYECLGMMAMLDKVFSKYDTKGQARFSKGRHIFDSQPARIGFVAAVATYALGRPGGERNSDERAARIAELSKKAATLSRRVDAMNFDELGDFLKLDVLRETLSGEKRVGQVGRYERSVFYDGFTALVKDGFDASNMEIVWRAN
ncbi:hypothetical protein V3589_13300 [Sinorhizobium fredii]|uniref:hypothetical protein n=1 Tax=Rhizobium fredii TaxID=380 RepID=UPI0030B3437D